MAPARTTKSGEANLRSIATRGVVKRLKAEVSTILLSREAISNYTIYLGKLPGLDKKARVAFDWTLDLLFRKDVCAVHTLPPRVNVQPLFPTDQGTEVIRPGRIGLSCDWESGSYR
jgi:hypothetical protein